jgi:hypothetical protein
MRFLSTLLLLALAAYARARAGCGCEPLGTLVNGRHDTVATVAELRASIAGQASPLEIYLRAGDYPIDASLVLDRPGIIVRSLDGNSAGVTIRGIGSARFPAFVVGASNTTIADLTIRDIPGMAVAVLPAGSAGNIVIHNVGFVNAAEGFIRMTCPATLANCFLECCSFSYDAPPARPAYTPGVEAESVSNLYIQDCRFDSVVSGVPGGGAAVVVRGASRNVTIERCRFIDCDMGITIGDSASFSNSVQGGTIRANFIKGHPSSGNAISVLGAQAITIDHNTIYSPGGSSSRSIDVRFHQSLGNGVTDNLVDEVIEQRDGVFGLFTEGNIEHATAADFRGPAAGDLHLAPGSAAIDAAANGQEEDIDCDPLADNHPDVGADEYTPPLGVEPLPRASRWELDYDPAGNTAIVRGRDGEAFDFAMVDMRGRAVGSAAGIGGRRVTLPMPGRGVYVLIARGRRGEAMSRKVIVKG